MDNLKKLEMLAEMLDVDNVSDEVLNLASQIFEEIQHDKCFCHDGIRCWNCHLLIEMKKHD